MLSPADIAWLANHLFSFLSGLIGSMFILIVNFIYWLKGNTDFASCDLLLSSLALCSLGDICLGLKLNIILIFSQVLLPFAYTLKVIITILACLRCCNFWFGTWFCVYCCVKIVRFTHPFLVILATRFLKNIPWVLLATVFVSFGTCIPIATSNEMRKAVNSLSNISNFQDNSDSDNGSFIISQINLDLSVLKYAYFVNISMVYIIFLSAAVPILLTLCRHVKRMGQNADSFTNPSMDAHLGAVKTVASLLILYSLFYLAHCGRFLKDYLTESIVESVATVMRGYFPAASCTILIFGISRLKITFCSMISHILCSERGGV